MNATTTKTAKAATAKTTKPAAKVSLAKTKASAPELPNISSVKLVPIDLIDIWPQTRTIFDDDTLRELASDIEARGLLQPVLLNPNGARFDLIAGERRVRACRIIGLTDIPALITKASSGDALLMQLAENIQREDLELQDQVNAIRLLHDNLGTVAAVAETVKKSAGWVSKRLALSHEDLDWRARNLMENGVTEDVEILNTFDQISHLNFAKASELEQQLRKGTATRESARAMLKELKEAQKQAKKDATASGATTSMIDPAERERLEADWRATQARDKAQREQDAAERKHGTGPLFIDDALDELQTRCAEPLNNDDDDDATHYLNTLSQDQHAALLAYLQDYQDKALGWTWEAWAKVLTPWDSEQTYLERYVAVMAIKGETLDNLYALITILEGANREGEQ